MCLKTTLNRNLLTLQPNNQDLKKLFWNYRCTDISEMFSIRLAIVTLAWLVLLASYIKSPNAESLRKFIFRTGNLILCSTVWLLGRRFKQHLIWFIPVLYTFELVLIVKESSISMAGKNDNENKVIEVPQFLRMSFDYLFYASLLTPSWNFVLLFYSPGIFGALGLSAILNQVESVSDAIKDIGALPMTYLPIGIIIFYILQKRELKRFSQEQVAVSKEKVAIKK